MRLTEICIAGFGGQGVILSGDPIAYPYVAQPDVLVVSQEAYTRFAPELKPGGT